jgi:hypothetical protein
MQETLGQLSAVALSAFDLDVEFVVFGMVTEHSARLMVEGPSRRGSRVVVVTDAVQPLVPPKGTQILKDLQSRMQAFSLLSRCWLLCVTTISAELSPGLLLSAQACLNRNWMV